MIKKWTVLLFTLLIGTSLYPAASSRWSGLARPLARWFSTNPTPPAPPIRPDVAQGAADNRPTYPQPDNTPVRRTQTVGTRLRPVTEIIAESRRRQGLPERTSIIFPEEEYAAPINVDEIDFSTIDPDILNQVVTPSAVSGTRRWLDRNEQDVSSFGGSYVSPKEYEALRKNFASAHGGRSQGLFDILPEKEKTIEEVDVEPTPVAHPNANENLNDYNVPFSMFGEDDDPIIERPLNQPRRSLLNEQEPTALRVREATQAMPYGEQPDAFAPVDSSAVEQFHYRPEVLSPSTEIKGELNAPRTVLDATQGSDGVWRYNPTGQTEAHTPAIQPTSKIIPYTSPSTELAPVDSSAVKQFHYRPEVLSPSTEISGELNAPRTVLDATQGSDGVWRYNPTGQTEAHTPAIQPTSKIIPYTSPSTELAPVDSSAVEQFHYRPEVLSRSTEIKEKFNAPRTVLDATLETDGVWRVTPEQPTAYTSRRELVPMHTQANLVPVQQHDRVVINVDQNELATLLQHAMRANTIYTHGRATTAHMADFLATYLEEASGQSSALVPYTKKNNELIPFKEQTNALVPTETKTRTSTLTINRDDLERLLDTVLDPYGRTTPKQAAQLLAPEFERVLEQFCNQTTVTPAAHQQQSTPLRIAASDAPAQLALPAPKPEKQTALVIVHEAETGPSLWDKAKDLGDKIKNFGSRPDVQQTLVTAGAGAASMNQRTRLLARRLAKQGNRVFTAVARRQPVQPKALMPPKANKVPARIQVLKRAVDAPIKVMPKRTVKTPTRAFDTPVKVAPRKPIREVPARVTITHKSQPVARRTVDQNSFNSQAAQPREIAPRPAEQNAIIPRNTVRNTRDRLAKPRPTTPRTVEQPVMPRGTANRAQRRVIDFIKERDGVYRAPKPARTNVPKGTVRNARARLIEPREVAPKPIEQPVMPRGTVNRAQRRVIDFIKERDGVYRAPKPARTNVPKGTVRNARARIAEAEQQIRDAAETELLELQATREAQARNARIAARRRHTEAEHQAIRIAEAEANALRQARARAARDAEIRDVIREGEARRRPGVEPRPAQPAPPLRPVRPRAVLEAEENALREARARAARRDELRDVIREREARDRRVIDFAQGRDGVWRAPRQPARVNVAPAAAPRLGRVRRLINAIEEAAQNVWQRARDAFRPRVAPRRAVPAVPAAPRAMARLRPRLPHPRVLGGLRNAEVGPDPRPLPIPRRPRPVPEDAVEDPIVPPIPRPRVFPALNPVLPPARALIPEEPEELEEEIIEEEANKDSIEDNEEYNYEEEDNDNTPGVATKPEDKEDTDEPSKPDSTKTDTGYSPSIAPAPPEKSLGTRTKQPASKTLGATYTGFTPLVNDIEAWLQKTLPPKVTSMIISKNNQETKPEIRIFTPQNRTIDVKNQKRMLTQNHTQQDKPKATNAPAQLKDSKVGTTKDWFSNIWETIKSVGKKITNFVRPLMFWVH